MPAINIDELLPQMLNAAAGVLKKQWPEVRAYAESEFKKIGQSLLFIQAQTASGAMTQKQAQLHLDLQKFAAQNVLLALEGMDILAAEAAINAALAVIKDAVNKALGFALL